MTGNSKSDLIKLCASIVTALGMIMLVPMMSWLLITVVAHGERIVSLETWRGEGDRYTDIDATRDFGVIVPLIQDNKDGVKENRLAIRDLEKKIAK